MTDLEQARRQIDSIDAQMTALFEERMAAVTAVARYKAETGMAVFDASREDAVVARNTARLQDAGLAEYYEDFIRHTMAVSRATRSTSSAWIRSPTRAWKAPSPTLPPAIFFPTARCWPMPAGTRCSTL